jgi:hypothetical protein
VFVVFVGGGGGGGGSDDDDDGHSNDIESLNIISALGMGHML